MNPSSQLGFIFLLLGLAVLAGFGLIRLFGWLGVRTETKIRRRAARRFQAVENRYEDFIRRRMTPETLADPENDLERLTGDALVALEPHIESLLATLAPPGRPPVQLSLKSLRFNKAVSRLETLLNRAPETGAAPPFTETDEQAVRNAFRSDIRSDLESRILAIKMENAPTS